MKVFETNDTKSHVMLTTDNVNNVEGNIISNVKTVKLLGITFDNKLSFKPHLHKIHEKGSQKLDALVRTSTCIS